MHAETIPQTRSNGRIRRDLAITSIACLVLLLPFINKPISLDDPPYVWVARQICVHPFDFYGFKANWYGTLRPMFEYAENPPLASYYLAVIGKLSGWRLQWMHAGFALVAMMSGIGVYLLANEFCERPLAATLLFLICPGFLVSATSLMYDVPMLSLWVWSMLAWLRGCRGNAWLFPVSGLCAAAGILTKFTAINLLPLLIAHLFLNRQRQKVRSIQIFSLLIPIVAICAFEWFTWMRYGHRSVLGAAHFSMDQSGRQPATFAVRTIDAFAYLGGTALAAALVVTVAMGRLAVSIFAVVTMLLACAGHVAVHHADGWLAFASIARAAGIAGVSNGRPVWGFDIQFGFLSAAGVAVMAACVWVCLRSSESRQRKDGLFLFLWIAGVFVFAGYLNWKINVRSLLPMLPAVCIVVIRTIELTRAASKALPLVLTAIGAAIFAITVAFGDFQIAVANRNAAADLVRPGYRIWFSGHWGFQYYMQEHGAVALDETSTVLAAGDLLVVALNNYGSPHLDGMMLVGKLEIDPGIGVTTLSQPLGANFYGSDGNQLPFAIGSIPPEPFVIFKSLATNRRQAR